MPASNGRALTLLATSLGFGVIQLDVSVVNVAIKPIGQSLGGDVDGLQWVVNAYTVAFAALILTAGTLGDRIGARRVFVAGFCLFTLASAACGLAPSLGALIAARAVQGLGAAVLAPSSLTLLNHAYSEPGERARAVGLWAAGASVGLAGGPLVGGVLTTALGWRAIFFINVPLGALGIYLTLRHARETSRQPDGRFDVGGQIAAVLCLATLAGATIQGGSGGFTQPLVLGGYAIAVAAGAAFLLVESRRTRPMLPLGLFRTPAFSAAAAVGLLINIVFYGLIFVLSLYFQRGQSLSALETGLAFAPSTVAILVANLLAGRADARFGPRRVIGFGAVLMVLSTLSLLGAESSTPYGAVVVQLVVLGAGQGLIVPAMTAAILASVETRQSGVAAGTLNSARQSGSVLGVALFGALVSSHGVVPGLHAALVVGAALAVAVAVLARTMPARTAS